MKCNYLTSQRASGRTRKCRQTRWQRIRPWRRLIATADSWGTAAPSCVATAATRQTEGTPSKTRRPQRVADRRKRPRPWRSARRAPRTYETGQSPARTPFRCPRHPISIAPTTQIRRPRPAATPRPVIISASPPTRFARSGIEEVRYDVPARHEHKTQPVDIWSRRHNPRCGHMRRGAYEHQECAQRHRADKAIGARNRANERPSQNDRDTARTPTPSDLWPSGSRPRPRQTEGEHESREQAGSHEHRERQPKGRCQHTADDRRAPWGHKNHNRRHLRDHGPRALRRRKRSRAMARLITMPAPQAPACTTRAATRGLQRRRDARPPCSRPTPPRRPITAPACARTSPTADLTPTSRPRWRGSTSSAASAPRRQAHRQPRLRSQATPAPQIASRMGQET